MKLIIFIAAIIIICLYFGIRIEVGISEEDDTINDVQVEVYPLKQFFDYEKYFRIKTNETSSIELNDQNTAN